jgi:hypothetical protein
MFMMQAARVWHFCALLMSALQSIGYNLPRKRIFILALFGNVPATSHRTQENFMSLAPIAAFINGCWTDLRTRFVVRSPVDQQILAEVSDCGTREAEAAAQAATQALAPIARIWQNRLDLGTLRHAIPTELPDMTEAD